ncbi:MAG TPA: DUF4258 domain-containing protein [Blastocatellia bacterium]|nr:DUF4258 domain-containing protein [Blastocatellia bacterium]
MAKGARNIQLVREKVRNQEYEIAAPHFYEEMRNDRLIFADVEAAIASGHVTQTYTHDPRGVRYEIVGEATDGRMIAVICRIKLSGNLLFITTWALE